MGELHVVIGAGPVGAAITGELLDRGHEVRIVTRSGSGPEHERAERVAADAGNERRLLDLTRDAVALYNAANPPYHRWPTDWPPIAAAVLAAAERSGAVLVTVSNLYAYGPVDRPLTEDLPLASTERKGQVRARMWQDALAAHRAGRVRAVELRASDYTDARQNSHLERNVPAALAGRRVRVLGSPDQPHSWTATGDVARLAVLAAADPSAHGRPWHVPSAPPRTQRQALTEIAQAAGSPEPTISVLGSGLLRALGLFSPTVRELVGTSYQFTAPFVLDDSAARAHFGMSHTPWEDQVRRLVERAHEDGDHPASVR